MKLLLDQNLSARLVRELEPMFPGSTHVGNVGLANADDVAIWEHARKHGFSIVSKDAAFHQRSFLFGHPPKVIWVRLRNGRRARTPAAKSRGDRELRRSRAGGVSGAALIDAPDATPPVSCGA